MNIHLININYKYTVLFLSVVIQLFCISLFAQDLQVIKDLSGDWKFSIGDNPAWAETNFNDSNWESIKVPGAWEMAGFYGYDGYAWYRKTVPIPKTLNAQSVFLQVGYIDDVDEVYINGKLVGRTGNFPPDYSTAYNANRTYIVPTNMLVSTSDLTIAIRVFDEGGEGGILHGKIALSIDKKAILPDLNLQGEWKFKTGNCGNPTEKPIAFDDWAEILVPGSWEDQGYKDYDGIACYAKQFVLNEQFTNEDVVIMLGKIDDLDMVYINGVLVGQSGAFNKSTAMQRSEMYKQLRGYYIPKNVLNHNGINTIIVKVYDLWGTGGIWEGNIGLITQDNYISYWRKFK